MSKKLVCFVLSATLMGLAQVSVAQQVTKPQQPSPEVLHKKLNKEPSRARAGAPAQPDAEYLRDRLVFKLPPVWRVESLEIKDTHNAGTASAPVYNQSFEAQISLKENLYETVEEDVYQSVAPEKKKRIVRTVANEGDSKQLLGLATAVYLNGQYNVFFEFENLPAKKGRTLKDFDDDVLVQGSPEEREYTAERKHQKHEEHVAHEEEEALEHEKAEAKARKEAVEEARKRAEAAEKARKGAE